MTGTRIVHVPYKAVSQALNDMIGGQIDVIFDNQSSIAPFVTSDRVRPLAVTGPKRSQTLPNLPTLSEAGVKGYEITTWTAMIGPKGLPRPIVDKLNAEIQRACTNPKLVAVLAAQGASCATGTPEQFAQFVKNERVKWGDIVKKSGARID
jgi:tripartite-type tricarboxylate transporter receptor subunit TctC